MTQRRVSRLVIFAAVSFAVLGSMFAGSTFLYYQDFTPVRHDVVDGKTLADLNQAIEKNPNDADAFYERGHFHEERDERDNAIEDYTKTISLDPNHAKTYRGRAELYLMTSKYDLALADADKCIELMPGWYTSWCERARIEVSMEDYHKAIADVEKGLSLWPDSPFGLQILTQAYSGLGQNQKAIDTANQNVLNSKDPDDGYWSYWDRGLAFMRARQFSDAEADFKKSLGFHHKMSQGWGDLAYALAGQDKMDEAATAIKHCKSLDLFPARAFRLSGEMYRAGGKWNDALKEYSTSTSLEPWYGPGFYQRASAEVALGQLNSAKLDLQKSLKLQPWSAETNSLAAVVEDQLGNREAANEHLNKAFELTPDLPINFVNRARIKMNHGDFAGAVADCNDALKLNPRLPDAYDARSIALQKLGMNADADKDKDADKRLYWHNFAAPLKTASVATAAGLEVSVLRPGLDNLSPRNSVAVQAPTLPDAQTFALSCGAIWSDNLTRGPIDNRLEVFSFEPESVKWSRTFLDNNWEVYGKSTLDELLSSWEPSKAPDKPTAAFNGVRYIVVCRVGYMAGYVTKDQAWKQITDCARVLQAKFDSWQDLGNSYVTGRVNYYHQVPSDAAQFNNTMNALFTSPNRPPHRLSFKDTKLP